MASVEVNNPPKLNRAVLLRAWAQLSVYDRTASSLKQTFIRRRYIVIGITLIATIASVLTSLIGETLLTSVLAVIAIAFPIVGSYVMTDVIKFSGTTDWIKYRFTAEMMRMNVYLYRMQAGKYAECLPSQADDLLIDQLRAVRDEISPDEGIPPTVSEPGSEQSIIQVINEANYFTPDDDGLSEIEVANYVKWRIDNQRQWYDSRIAGDFARWKLLFRAAQIVLLVGALLGAFAGFLNIQLVALVAIANAIAAALSLWSDVGMTGKTYALFRIASNQLGNQKDKWLAIQDNPEFQDPATRVTEIANLAVRVENVLLWERQEWFELALQSQATSDEMILGDLKNLTQRAEAAQDET